MMAKKFGWSVLLWIAVVAAYLVMTVLMPATNSLVSTANASLVATSNMSNYPGLQEGIETAPLWLYFVPALAGVVLQVIILKTSWLVK